jgi:hypothetical protein
MQVFLLHFLLISVFVHQLIVKLIYLFCLLFDVVLDLFSRNTICSPHRERVCYQPVVYDALGCCHELVSGVRTDLEPDRMNQTTSP